MKTILFFIGYSRSRHTLLGSLLDAHPHMVIADETMAFARWRSKQDIWISSSIYAYYDTLFKSSQRVVSEGRRSQIFKGSVANTTSKFRYYVPNQWQGTFDRYIEVSRTWDLHLGLKSRDPIGGACIRVLYIAEHTEGGQNMLQYRLLYSTSADVKNFNYFFIGFYLTNWRQFFYASVLLLVINCVKTLS